MRHRLRTLAGSVVAALAVLAPVAGADERTEIMVEALRQDPVFVSTALSRAVPRADLDDLRRAVKDAPFPVFVVIAPSFSQEAGLETLDALPDLLHDGLDRDGLYIAMPGDYAAGIAVQAFGVQTKTDLRTLPNDIFDDRRGSRAAELATYALSVAVTGRREPKPIPSEQGGPGGFQTLAAIGLGLGVGGCAFAYSGWPWLVGRRRRRRTATDEPVPPSRTTPIDVDQERERAQAGVLRLSGKLASAGSPPAAAFDAYAAASKLLAEGGEPIALVAAATLVDTGEWLLEGSDARSCFFDPRHGEGGSQTRWRLGGEEVPLPACAACARLVARELAPAAVEDRGRPYFERDTLWARTGLGALDDGLAGRVLAGEGRR